MINILKNPSRSSFPLHFTQQTDTHGAEGRGGEGDQRGFRYSTEFSFHSLSPDLIVHNVSGVSGRSYLKSLIAEKMVNRQLLLTYGYLLMYISLSSGVILYNKWVLSPNYFNFPFPITLTMIHMGFSGAVSFFLVRIFKVVAPVKMTNLIYLTCVIPISAFFAGSLWFGNTAYLHISVAFIQMLKSLMPVATFLVAVMCNIDKLRCDIFVNMVLISVGVVISSYGEIHFNVIGTVFQVSGIFAEALRLVLTQVLIQKKGLTLNPVTSLYYIAPCSFLFLLVPWYWFEKPKMEISQIQFNFWIFFSNAMCALVLNFSIFLVIGRTGAVTIRVAGVLKDWILIALSTVIFPESIITWLNAIGYAIALCGVVMYNYLKSKDIGVSNQLPVENISEKTAKEWKLEKKSSDIVQDDNNSGHRNNAGTNNGGTLSSSDSVDVEAPLLPSLRISHFGSSRSLEHR
ncbi:Phosphate translocator-like protein [Zostera marina]|uniref:Phosphate translocator-like protein n=1 Tax=Zostera marina TaxID=29655 RepID=A0A0K9PYU6_ZOSMR|nr:Phosphate translocator-like protein [Zostera marina]